MNGGAPIPIIGATGALGFGLALRLASAGEEVVVGSRDPGRAEATAERIREQASGASVSGMGNAEAAAGGETVFLAVPFRAQAGNLKEIGGALRAGQTLVDATVPLAVSTGGKPTRLLGVPQGSAAQQAQELAPAGVSVVAALHTVDAATLGDLEAPLDQDVLLCGDRKEDKLRVARLLRRIPGLRPVNAGPLEAARLVEALTPLLISMNIRYKAHAGVKLTGLPDTLW